MTTGKLRYEVATMPRPESNGTLIPSRQSTQRQQLQLLPAAAKSIEAIGPALERLVAMKNHVDLTPFAIETWAAVLSQFDLPVVYEAVLRIGLSEDPFPDLGKLVARCDAIRRQRSGIVSQVDKPQLSSAMVGRVASALGLRIE